MKYPNRKLADLKRLKADWGLPWRGASWWDEGKENSYLKCTVFFGGDLMFGNQIKVAVLWPYHLLNVRDGKFCAVYTVPQ